MKTALLSLFTAAVLPAALRLEDLEKMALEKNPSLAGAAAAVRVAAGNAVQAGLYPNPVIGVNGDEIAGGPIIRGGELGGFFEQRIVTAGKLRLSRGVAEREKDAAAASAATERVRVLNTVRALFYQALGDERRLQVRSELAAVAHRAAATAGELSNIGKMDRPDVLAAEIEAQRADLSLAEARHAQGRTWRQLAAAVNHAALQPQPLEGDLETLPPLDAEAALEAAYRESPEMRAAEAERGRYDLAVRRAQREIIPDLMVRGGVRYNRELLEFGRPVGLEGFFDVGVRIPLFDRNHGAIAAAKADAERARHQLDRTRLALRSRLAALYKEYQDAVTAAAAYRTQMIPRAKEAHEMYLKNFHLMAGAYPQVLMAQRTLFQLRDDYIGALVAAWRGAVEIQSLLTGDAAGDHAPR